MLESVSELTYAIVLCEDMDLMKTFYRNLLPFPVVTESATSMSMDAGGVLLGLRLRERDYDGRGGGSDQPRGHRTVYFSDPEGNVLEVYAEI